MPDHERRLRPPFTPPAWPAPAWPARIAPPENERKYPCYWLNEPGPATPQTLRGHDRFRCSATAQRRKSGLRHLVPPVRPTPGPERVSRNRTTPSARLRPACPGAETACRPSQVHGSTSRKRADRRSPDAHRMRPSNARHRHRVSVNDAADQSVDLWVIRKEVAGRFFRRRSSAFAELRESAHWELRRRNVSGHSADIEPRAGWG